MFAPSAEAEQSLTGWFHVGYERCADEAVGFLEQFLEPEDYVIQGLRGHLRIRNPLKHQDWHQQEQGCYNRQNHGELRRVTDVVFLPFESKLLSQLGKPSTTHSRLPHLLKDGEQLSSDRDIGCSLCFKPVHRLFVPSLIVPTCSSNPLVSCLTQQDFHPCHYPDNERHVVTPDQSNVSPIFTTSCNDVVTQRFCDKTRCNCDEPTFDNLSENASLQRLDIQFLKAEKNRKEEEEKESEETCRNGDDTELIDSAAELIRFAVNNPNVSKLLDKLFLLMDEVERDEEEMDSECEEEEGEEENDYCKECEMEMNGNEE